MNREQCVAFKDACESGSVDAFIDGNPIEYRYDAFDWYAFKGDSPDFGDSRAQWRPAPQPQRKPITAEEAFELWGKVVLSADGKEWRITDTFQVSVTLAGPSGVANLTFEQLLNSGYTLDGHVICSGMSTKPQPGSVHVKLPPANG